MSFRGDEAALVAAAEQALGVEVLAAGVFSWQELVKGQVAGLMAGGVAGGAVGDLLGGPAGDLAGAVGAVAGGRAGVEAMAEKHGMTVALLVAVTTDDIVVRNLQGQDVGEEIARFPRATTHVSINRFGLSRVLVLQDPETGDRLALHGSVAPFSAQHTPDKVVLHLLAAPG